MKNNQKELSIVCLSTRTFPDIGGPAKGSYFISYYLAKEYGVSVRNISARPPAKIGGIEKILENFEIHWLDVQSPDLNSGLIPNMLFFIKFILKSFREAKSIHKKENIDVIIARSPSLTSIIAYLMKKLYKIPYIYVYHGLDFKNKLESFIDKFIVNRSSDLIISVSDTIYNSLKRRKSFSNERYRLIPNGVECPDKVLRADDEEFKKISESLDIGISLTRNHKIITYVGYMIIQQKVLGMIDFAKAFDLFLDELDNEQRNQYVLLFVGDGPYKKDLEKAVLGLKHKDHVFLIGKRNDVEKIYSISSLCALTSYIEGFPNVLLEGMISGLPCIASNVGDISKILGDTGYLVSPGDISAIKETLKRYFMSDIQDFNSISKKIFDRVKSNFDYKVVSGQYLKYIKDVCSN